VILEIDSKISIMKSTKIQRKITRNQLRDKTINAVCSQADGMAAHHTSSLASNSDVIMIKILLIVINF